MVYFPGSMKAPMTAHRRPHTAKQGVIPLKQMKNVQFDFGDNIYKIGIQFFLGRYSILLSGEWKWVSF